MFWFDTVENELKEKRISESVCKTTFDILNCLSSNILNKLKINNIYSTSYGTICFDWKFHNTEDEFSLEIGNGCFGYFSEKDGKDIARVEDAQVSGDAIIRLSKDIKQFYNR